MSATVYSTILDDFTVLTAAHPTENELGASAFATYAVLAPQTSEDWRRARLQRAIEEFGSATARSVFRCPANGILPHQDWLHLTGRPVIHEGFFIDPSTESADALDTLREQLGERLWYSPPHVWLRWGNKSAFRRRCRELLGIKAQPPGIEIIASERGDVARALDQFRHDAAGTVIVKFPGIGGTGNVVVSSATEPDFDGAIDDQWRRLLRFPADIVIEDWIPWDTSYSVSYFLPAEHQQPKLVTVCQQLVDRRRARFVGSRSRTDICQSDLDALVDWLSPVVSAMHSDGCVGIVALDVVIDSARRWGHHGYRLPSGKHVNVIECNPRFNRHNRVGVLVERLARLWDMNAGDLQWTLNDRYPPSSVSFPNFAAQLMRQIDPPPFRGHAQMLLVDRLDRAMQLSVRPQP